MFVHCSPNPNVTRYKRTALTHAVMNGSASVASFLLRRGLDPDGADTSGNANLHYACAYGWYHCAKLLVDAGADVNAANEWRLTPVKAGQSGQMGGLVGLDLRSSPRLLKLPFAQAGYKNHPTISADGPPCRKVHYVHTYFRC